MELVRCDYCQSEAHLKDSSVVYGKSYGMIYICSSYPTCDAFVGVHEKTNKPLGRLANSELREYKKRAHSYFDVRWKNTKFRKGDRSSQYKWLSEKLEISARECHIGMFDVDMCKKVIQLCNENTQ